MLLLGGAYSHMASTLKRNTNMTPRTLKVIYLYRSLEKMWPKTHVLKKIILPKNPSWIAHY